jgi:hypothetical protein
MGGEGREVFWKLLLVLVSEVLYFSLLIREYMKHNALIQI